MCAYFICKKSYIRNSLYGIHTNHLMKYKKKYIILFMCIAVTYFTVEKCSTNLNDFWFRDYGCSCDKQECNLGTYDYSCEKIVLLQQFSSVRNNIFNLKKKNVKQKSVFFNKLFESQPNFLSDLAQILSLLNIKKLGA